MKLVKDELNIKIFLHEMQNEERTEWLCECCFGVENQDKTNDLTMQI